MATRGGTAVTKENLWVPWAGGPIRWSAVYVPGPIASLARAVLLREALDR